MKMKLPINNRGHKLFFVDILINGQKVREEYGKTIITVYFLFSSHHFLLH